MTIGEAKTIASVVYTLNKIIPPIINSEILTNGNIYPVASNPFMNDEHGSHSNFRPPGTKSKNPFKPPTIIKIAPNKTLERISAY